MRGNINFPSFRPQCVGTVMLHLINRLRHCGQGVLIAVSHISALCCYGEDLARRHHRKKQNYRGLLFIGTVNSFEPANKE